MRKMGQNCVSWFMVCIVLVGGIPASCGGVEDTAVNMVVAGSDDFNTTINALMELGHFPGLVCGIVKNNTLVWSAGFGNATLGRGPLHARSMTTDTVFSMASISKSVAATAIMQLHEAGLLSLDENVSHFLPFDLKNPRYPKVNVTLRMLLAHQSSIKELGLWKSVFSQVQPRPLRWLERHFEKESSWFGYAPGENVSYATVNSNIVGFVVETIMGMSYAAYCKQYIFSPLQMSNTSFYAQDFMTEQFVGQYVWLSFFYIRVPVIWIAPLMFPGGGLRSTLDDMSHLLIMHTSGGVYDGVRVLSEASVAEMHRAQYPETLDGTYYHGLGWYFRNETGNETVGGHDGNHLGNYVVMKMRYAEEYGDQVGILYFFNQHSYVLMTSGNRPEWERQAVIGLRDVLFDYADEL